MLISFMIDEEKKEGINNIIELKTKLIILIIVMTVDAGCVFQTRSGRRN
jgi:hypothetical protein